MSLKKFQGGTAVDLVIGGPPCQGFSIAGNIGRKFVDDKRNYLFKEFVRVIHVLKPRMFVMENVARIATHRNGKTITEICNAFSREGYDVQYKVLNAVHYGCLKIDVVRLLLARLSNAFTFLRVVIVLSVSAMQLGIYRHLTTAELPISQIILPCTIQNKC